MIQAEDQVGQYKIVRRLGSGGMATVYLAVHPRLDRQVALKVMHDAFQQDEEYLTRFEREARIVAGLEHPHIIPVYDYSEHEGKPYLVMKYVQGRSLKAMLEADKHPPSLTEVLNLLDPIASALDYAHSKGILHRDVKPSNIMLDEQNIPYLADFGLARIAMAGESTLSQDVILGTPQYISPEQAQGKVNIDGRTDIYSLGIVLFQLLVGDVPFSADTPFAVIHDHIYRPLPNPQLINPDITPGIANVLEKVLAKSPDDRYPSATAMLTDLKQAADAADFEAIDAAYVSRATETLALLREQEDDLLTTPYTPRRIESPVNQTFVDSSTLVTEYQYKFGWIWSVGGLVAFLVFFIATGVVGSRIDGQALSRRVEMSEDIVTRQVEDVAAEVPFMTLRNARSVLSDGSEDPVAYMAAASAFWRQDRQGMALQSIYHGQGIADNTLQYLLAAGFVAEDLGQNASAILLYAEAAHLAETDFTEQFEVIRGLTGEAVFRLSTELSQSQQDIELFTAAIAQQETPSPDLTRIALAIIALAQENTDQAEDILASLDENDTRYNAEYDFLLGEYNWRMDDIEKAHDQWREAIDRDYTPRWIVEIVQQRLDATNTDTQ